MILFDSRKKEGKWKENLKEWLQFLEEIHHVHFWIQGLTMAEDVESTNPNPWELECYARVWEVFAVYL